MCPVSLFLGRPAPRRAAWSIFCLALLAVGASAETPPPVAPPPPVVPLPPAAPLPPIASVDRPAAGCPCLCGEGGSQFAIDLMLGMQIGVRGQAAVVRDDQHALVAEAFYGILVNKLAGGEGAGAGARYYWRRTDREGVNSVIFGPGAGMYYHFHDQAWMLAPTLDVAWVRAIGDNGAWQLGLNAGVGIGLSSNDSNDEGKVTPLFSLFTGFRF